MGIEAAGGNVAYFSDGTPCDASDLAAGGNLTVAYIGADLDEVSEAGLTEAVVEDPVHVISAYVNELNSIGGIGGRCVELEVANWSLSDPIGTYIEACNHLRHTTPLFQFNLRLYDTGLQCTSFGSPIPELGLHTAILESTVRDAGYLLYSDSGSVEHLTSVAVEVAVEAGVLTGSDPVGLLHGTGPSAGVAIPVVEELVRTAGFNLIASGDVPREFGDLNLLTAERQAGVLSPAMSQTASLPPQVLARLAEVEQFYLHTATEFRDAGVAAVLATASWADVRRLMRAAEIVEWTPLWLTSDIQPATLATEDAPARQVGNYMQVSSRRAAGDSIPPLDQGCIITRNGAADVEPFRHRPHTDAWNLIASVCDYLDVAFGAVTRIDGTIDHLSFLDALNRTHYDTGYGGLISYSSSDRHGADRYRILVVDQTCVLNGWGCMRAATDWLAPAHHMHHEDVSLDDIEQQMEDMGHDHSSPGQTSPSSDSNADDPHSGH